MGKVKLILRRLETVNLRHQTFSNRKPGVFKKARELATLCDVDLVLLVFSPTGKPTIFVSQKSDLTSIVEKLTKMSFIERKLRKSETLKILNNMFKNEDHKFDVNKFNGNLDVRLEELKRELIELQQHRNERNNKLIAWICPESVTDLDQIKAMEESIAESIEQLEQRRKILKERHPHKPSSSASVQENASYPSIPVEQLAGNHVLDFFPERNLGDLFEITEQTESLINIAGQVNENEEEYAPLGYQPWDDDLWNSTF